MLLPPLALAVALTSLFELSITGRLSSAVDLTNDPPWDLRPYRREYSYAGLWGPAGDDDYVAEGEMIGNGVNFLEDDDGLGGASGPAPKLARVGAPTTPNAAAVTAAVVRNAAREEQGTGDEEEEPQQYNTVKLLSDDDPRPRRNPKGELWTGHEPAAEEDDHAGSSNSWWRKTRMCFEVESICHRRAENEWFYYTPRGSKEEGRPPPLQPTMELKSAPDKYDGGRDKGDKRISIKVSSNAVAGSDLRFGADGKSFVTAQSKDECRISPVKQHIVVQSLFNDMIGEFYTRTLLRLFKLMAGDAVTAAATKTREEIVQFYVHVAYRNKKMLDGHKLLLSGMQSSPDAPEARSLVDLFTEPAEDGGGDCHCYETMVFCGYDTFTHDADILSEDLEPAAPINLRNPAGSGTDDNGGDDDDDQAESDRNDDDEEKSSAEEDGELPVTGVDPTLKYTLWSATKVGEDKGKSGENIVQSKCGRDGKTGPEMNKCTDWHDLRDFLASNFFKHYPTLERDLVKHRRKRLLDAGAIDEGYDGDTAEWTIVGLTQRSYRRAWLNLQGIIDKCNESFENTICVEVNVEKTKSPLEQLVLHRSLDALAGVHGAQLTQAVLLPPNAHVLEMLPWVTDYIRGKWVQTTHTTTPLGVIFHNTDLNHLGYSLDRDSVPLCKGVEEAELQVCFMKSRKKFLWESRDFNVDPRAVLDYIGKFVLRNTQQKTQPCEEMEVSLGDRFVLYNVHCTRDGNKVGVNHFYHDKPRRASNKGKAAKLNEPRVKLKKQSSRRN